MTGDGSVPGPSRGELVVVLGWSAVHQLRRDLYGVTFADQRAGRPVPEERRRLLGLLDRHVDTAGERPGAARSGQERPTWGEGVDTAVGGGDGDGMELLTYQQAGELIGCSDRTVRRLVASGGLPAVRVGRLVRVRRRDLDGFGQAAG